MALLKEFVVDAPNRIKMTYHRIIGDNYDWNKGKAVCSLAHYADAESRHEFNAPFSIAEMDITSLVDFSTQTRPTTQAIYDFIKSTPDYTDATDA